MSKTKNPDGWPRLPEVVNDGVHRIKVPGGWLILALTWSAVPGEIAGSVVQKPMVMGTTFFPDPDHKWTNLADFPPLPDEEETTLVDASGQSLRERG